MIIFWILIWLMIGLMINTMFRALYGDPYCLFFHLMAIILWPFVILLMILSFLTEVKL